MIVKYNCYMKKEDMFSRFEMKMLLFLLIFYLLRNSSESYKSKNDEEIKVDEEEELQLYKFIK